MTTTHGLAWASCYVAEAGHCHTTKSGAKLSKRPQVMGRHRGNTQMVERCFYCSFCFYVYVCVGWGVGALKVQKMVMGLPEV